MIGHADFLYLFTCEIQKCDPLVVAGASPKPLTSPALRARQVSGRRMQLPPRARVHVARRGEENIARGVLDGRRARGQAGGGDGGVARTGQDLRISQALHHDTLVQLLFLRLALRQRE